MLTGESTCQARERSLLLLMFLIGNNNYSDGQVNNNNARDIDGHIDVTDDRWHMYTLVAYPAAEDKPAGYRVYVDGRIAGIGFDVGGDTFSPLGNIFMCGRSDGDSDRYYGGRVAYLSIYNKGLTDDEVLAKAIQESIDQLSIITPPSPIESCEANGWHTDCNGKCFAEVYMQWVGDSI